jgi:hypothetical protein
MDATLTKTYPAYDLWRSWGARRARDLPPLPSSCSSG